MAKEKLFKHLHNIEPAIPIDPWVGCEDSLNSADAETPLSANQGKVLDEKKLDKSFPDANVGDFLAIDGNHNAVPQPLSDNVVDTHSDQQIAGEKTFLNITKAMGYMAGEVADGITVTHTNEGGIIMCSKNGQLEGKIKVEAKTFSDPYDATNTDVFSKDLKIKEMDDLLKKKSEVAVSMEPAPEAATVKSLGIDGAFYNLPSPNKIEPSQVPFDDARDMRAMTIDDAKWNLPALTPSKDAIEGAQDLGSLAIGDSKWNIPGAKVKPYYPTPGTNLTVVTDVTNSCQTLGQLMILNVNFTIPAGKQGSDFILHDVPRPYETIVNVTGGDGVMLSVNATNVVAIVPSASPNIRTAAFNVVYSLYPS